jgi:hypothetical protein
MREVGMKTVWKVLVVLSLLLSAAASGISVAAFLGVDVEVAQSGPEDVRIDLTQVVLRYQDQLTGIGLEQITVRQVIQDALWFRINDASVDVETRTECFTMVGLFHEERATDVTQAQYDILMDAIADVWGPAVIQEFNELVGGAQ